MSTRHTPDSVLHASRLHLGRTSAAPRLHLDCISAASRLHLGCISTASRLERVGGCANAQRRGEGARLLLLLRQMQIDSIWVNRRAVADLRPTYWESALDGQARWEYTIKYRDEMRKKGRLAKDL